MTPATSDFAHRYRSLLQRHTREGAETDLQGAYELGRSALAEGIGILDLVALHAESVRAILRDFQNRQDPEHLLIFAQEFLVECLSPFEMAHRSFEETNAAWRQLNERLETEAKRIAHSLHDEAGQLLATVHISLAELAPGLSETHRRRLEETEGILRQVENELRRISHELRPTILDDLGLVPALKFLAEGVSKRAGLVIEVRSSVEERLPAELETALYRIVQEALTNVSRHARAKTVCIRLDRTPAGFACSIRDDGVGFEESMTAGGGRRRGLGLIGIRDRLVPLAGALSVTTGPGRGTELLIRVPAGVSDAAAHSSR